MAEAEESSRHNNNDNEEAEPGRCGSTSKDEEVEGTNININTNTNNNNNWLQLGIGLTSTKQDRDRTVPATTGSGPVELDLLPLRRNFDQPPAFFPVAVSGRGGPSFGGSSSFVFEHQTASPSSMSMSMASGPITSAFGHQEMLNWAFGPLLPPSMPIMPSSSSFTPLPPHHPPPSSSSSSSQTCHSSLRPPLGSYFPTPFHHFPSSSGFDQYDVAAAGPSSDVTVRVVDPPRRPHSGIWFMLQASQNQ